MEKETKPVYETLEQATDALRAVDEQFREHIARLGRNDIAGMFAIMNDDEFECFAALDVPRLMAWCAANKVPLDSGVQVRRTHSMLGNHEQLEKYFKRAVEGEIRPRRPEADKAGYRIRDYARNPAVYDRMCLFLEQIERTGAFPVEVSRDALGLLDGSEEVPEGDS